MGLCRLAIAEPLGIFGLIMLYIWWLRFEHPEAWLLILALVVFSHFWHGEGAPAIGFRAANLRACLRRFGPGLAFVCVLLFGAGLLFATARPLTLEQAALAYMAYLPWGLFQQYMLNGYFLNRMSSACTPRVAVLLTVALFISAHIPNWFLMLVTGGGGYWSVVVYRKYRNLLFLGIAHATIGFLLYLVVPDSISHHLRVGPGWFRH